MFASLALAAACVWTNPGFDPFMGDVVAAVDKYKDIPAETRTQLKAKMLGRKYDDLAVISKHGVMGNNAYQNLRDMHFGQDICKGPVDYSEWKDSHREVGLVYCVDAHCILVPTVCRNVSRVDPIPRPEFPQNSYTETLTSEADKIKTELAIPSFSSYEETTFADDVAIKTTFPPTGGNSEIASSRIVEYVPVRSPIYSGITQPIPEPATNLLMLVGLAFLFAIKFYRNGIKEKYETRRKV